MAQEADFYFARYTDDIMMRERKREQESRSEGRNKGKRDKKR